MFLFLCVCLYDAQNSKNVTPHLVKLMLTENYFVLTSINKNKKAIRRAKKC